MRGMIAVIGMAPAPTRQTAASTASMPKARSRHRGQAPQPRSGVPKAQGFTPAPRNAAQLSAPSRATDATSKRNTPRLAGSRPPAPTPQISTRLTDVTLTDAQWEKMQPFCLGKPTDPGRTGGDARLFLEAVLWIARTGSPWRDLPSLFGKWNSVFKRFRDWVKADVFKRMFEAVSDDPDMEYAMVDATIVKVHRHGQGAKGGLRAKQSATREVA